MKSIRNALRLIHVLPVAAFSIVIVGPSSADTTLPDAPSARAVLLNTRPYVPGARLSASPAAATDPSKVYSVPQVPKPACYAIFNDPTFDSEIVRIANNTKQPTTPVPGTWSAIARHWYSKQEPWNSAGTLLLMPNRNASPGWLILDGATYAPLYAVCDAFPGWDYRWHPSTSHPTVMFGVSEGGKELYWFDVESCRKTKSIALPISLIDSKDNYGLGGGEGNASNSGRYVALGRSDSMFVVDMDSSRVGPLYAIPPCGFDAAHNCWVGMVSISPSAKYVVINYKGDGPTNWGILRVFDVDTTTLRITGPHTMAAGSPRLPGFESNQAGWAFGFDHMDLAADPYTGADVAVGAGVYPPYDGHAIKVRLDTGAVTYLTNPNNEAYVRHASCQNLGRPGWAYFTYAKEDGNRFSNEVVAIKLDGSGSVERLCHTHSLLGSGSSYCYDCEPTAVPSRDGGRVVFASNWAQDCSSGCGSPSDIKDYVVTVDHLVAVEVSLVSTTAEPDHVSLVWYATGGETPTVTVYRQTDRGAWTALSTIFPDGAGYLDYEDHDVVPGTRYTYRLGVLDGGTEAFLGEASVEVPFRETFALEGLRPNPARQDLVVAFTLPSAAPATLELLDVSGRRMLSRQLAGLRVGEHLLSMGRDAALAPGMYWLRLTQGQRSLVRKACLAR